MTDRRKLQTGERGKKEALLSVNTQRGALRLGSRQAWFPEVGKVLSVGQEGAQGCRPARVG